jgi:hypothetical protein
MTLQPRKPFNITLVHPQNYVHSLALKEAADYLDATLKACGYASARTTNKVFDDAHNIIFCSHLLLDKHLAGVPPDTIIFNSEQLEDSDGWHFENGVYRNILERYFVWDYSFRNLSRISHDNKCVIPFLYCRDLVRPNIPRERGSFLLFYGANTDRRRRILDALQSAGVPVRAVFGQYGYQRDALMLRSWAVLNLHKEDVAVAFEPIRCFYPLINEVPIISEEVLDPSADAFRDSIFFFEQSSLIDGILHLYTNADSFAARSGDMLASFKHKSPLADVTAAVEQFLRRWG